MNGNSPAPMPTQKVIMCPTVPTICPANSLFWPPFITMQRPQPDSMLGTPMVSLQPGILTPCPTLFINIRD